MRIKKSPRVTLPKIAAMRAVIFGAAIAMALTGSGCGSRTQTTTPAPTGSTAPGAPSTNTNFRAASNRPVPSGQGSMRPPGAPIPPVSTMRLPSSSH